MNFKEIIKKEELIKVIEELGFEEPTEIQSKIIPLIASGKDVIGQSKTGTGKTLAFAVPLLEGINDNGRIQAVILAPTRELAMQIGSDFTTLSKYTNIKNAVVYGSSSIERQIKEIRTGVEVVIGTPGRVMDLVKRNIVKVKNLKYFILDEADEMLSMGFHEELETIFQSTNEDKQVLLFSATMPKQIKKLAEDYMKEDYKVVNVENNVITADNIEQVYITVSENTRSEVASRVLDYKNPKRCIVFCRTKRNADELLSKLQAKGYSVDVIHGDITQEQRIKTLDNFKKGIFNILIATDVAARGIHVDDIELVLNYNLPESNESYVHRIGRTGRANKSGLSVTLVSKREEKIIPSIEKHINKKIKKVDTPKLEDIIPVRINEITSELDSFKTIDNTESKFNEYLNTLTESELKNIINKLLNDKINDKLGSNFDVDVTVENSKKRTRNKDNGDSTRVFLTIGKLDKIEKRELLTFIEKTAFIREGTCFNVEIMPKFTFMNISNSEVDKVIENINNKRLKGRLIKIEKAKK